MLHEEVQEDNYYIAPTLDQAISISDKYCVELTEGSTENDEPLQLTDKQKRDLEEYPYYLITDIGDIYGIIMNESNDSYDTIPLIIRNLIKEEEEEYDRYEPYSLE